MKSRQQKQEEALLRQAEREKRGDKGQLERLYEGIKSGRIPGRALKEITRLEDLV